MKSKTAKLEKGHTVVTMIETTFSSDVLNHLSGNEEYSKIRISGDPYKLLYFIRTVFVVNKANQSPIEHALESAKKFIKHQTISK